MAKEVIVKGSGRDLKLTNLDKNLFSDPPITKAELMAYYIAVAPDFINFSQNRPLTLIRYPDGIQSEKFYAKNKPSWTPEWLSSVALPDKPEIAYLLAQNQDTLVYLANLAAIEIHAMCLSTPSFLADHIIFDLDPPENFSFDELILCAQNLKRFLNELNHEVFLKTSGGKGLHLYIPLHEQLETEMAINMAKNMAAEFIKRYPNSTTLLLSKEKRTQKILIDIYRNHRAQTCVTPFSVRGRPNAPVSMPIFWEDLPTLKSSQDFNINNAIIYLKEKGNAWQGFFSRPDLESYQAKRDFSKTPEPNNATINTDKVAQNAFVVHKHQATNLHYDLRLNMNGVLASWAIPKALPHLPGIKRMAIKTEDHPLAYFGFEGEIPKGEYGGGTMWIFDTGTYHIIEQTDKKIKFSLKGKNLNGQFVIYHTDENRWLLERLDEGLALKTWPKNFMLAELNHKLNTGSYFYEIKWDGIRALLIKEGENVDILSKSGASLKNKFPEIIAILKEIQAETAVIDAEIVVLDNAGKPQFNQVIGRMHSGSDVVINQLAKTSPATAYAFDLLFLDALDSRTYPIETRRAWLRLLFKDTYNLRFSQSFTDGLALFEAIKSQGLEGIMVKKQGGFYKNGRSSDWQKYKVNNLDDALIIGYTKGKGDRQNLFGALLLGDFEEEKLVFKGKVGTGFTADIQDKLYKTLLTLNTIKKPIKDSIEEEYAVVWVEPLLRCSVKFSSITPNLTYREPVYMGLYEE